MRVTGLILIVLTLSTATWQRPSAADVSPHPNLILILTDDQRYDELAEMPNVMSGLVGKGTTFANGYVTNPLCCPSRATILTGNYSHTTGVYGNYPPIGGFSDFTQLGDDQSTIATWLQDAGYRTGLFGKYLNGYSTTNAAYVPPGWNRWAPLIMSTPGHGDVGGYYDYDMSLDGKLRHFGTTDANYSTDVLASYTQRFITRTPSAQPVFVYFSVRAPHGPTTPPRRYLKACSGYTPPVYPNFNEQDMSDKPAYMQALPRLNATRPGHMINMCRSLLAVDDAVGRILETLQATGRLQNSLIVFTSDNGLEVGSHRWMGKTVPYEESVRVPIVVRYDGVTASGTVESNLVLNLDIAPTFADAADAQTPGTEGVSFMPLLDRTALSWRDDFLIEHEAEPQFPNDVPTYCAVHSADAVYVKYATGEEELYDLNQDPYELNNVALDPAYLDLKAELHARMLILCSPPPSNFTP